MRATQGLSDLAVASGQRGAEHGRASRTSPSRVLSRADLDELGIGVPRVHRGLIASGDQFSFGSRQRSHSRRHSRYAGCGNGGAAVAQVCHDYGVPFTIIRHFRPGRRAAHVDFERFIGAVASPLSHAMVDAMLQRLQQAD